MKQPSEPMAHVEFIADYIFTPDEDRRSSIKYHKGFKGLVRKQCADKAIAANRAKLISTPRRKAPPSQ